MRNIPAFGQVVMNALDGMFIYLSVLALPVYKREKRTQRVQVQNLRLHHLNFIESYISYQRITIVGLTDLVKIS